MILCCVVLFCVVLQRAAWYFILYYAVYACIVLCWAKLPMLCCGGQLHQYRVMGGWSIGQLVSGQLAGQLAGQSFSCMIMYGVDVCHPLCYACSISFAIHMYICTSPWATYPPPKKYKNRC